MKRKVDSVQEQKMSRKNAQNSIKLYFICPLASCIRRDAEQRMIQSLCGKSETLAIRLSL